MPKLTADTLVSLPLSRDDASVGSLVNSQSSAGDDFAASVDVERLLRPACSDYHYSDANRSGRRMLGAASAVGKVRHNNKTLSRGMSLDTAAILAARSRASSYRGPAPLLRDGAPVRSALKHSVPRGDASVDAFDDSAASLCGASAADDSLAPRRSRSGGVNGSGDGGDGGDGPGPPPRHHCAFSCVDIREYERVAGDNPSVTRGVPLAIGWGYHQHGAIALEEYEDKRGPPRDKVEMLVPPDIRERLLRDEHGVPATDVLAALRTVDVAKRERARTGAAEPFEGLTEAAETARRRLRRLLPGGTSKAREEERMWAEARRQEAARRGAEEGGGGGGGGDAAARRHSRRASDIGDLSLGGE